MRVLKRLSAMLTSSSIAMDGHNGLLGKLFHLVMNMDKMVGGDFERGLAALKSVSEAVRGPAAAVANAPTPH
jgi:hypothetical protein